METPRRSARFRGPESVPVVSTTTVVTTTSGTTTTLEARADNANDTPSSVVSPSPAKKRGRTKGSKGSTAKSTPAKAKKTDPAAKATKKRQRKAPPAPGSKTPPKGWEEIYSLVEELRQDKSAPVDEAGAEVLPEKSASQQVFRFQVLIALMLSSQTKDAVVGDAMRKLQEHGLTVENIAHNTTPEQLNSLIAKVGFHNNKTKYIKEAIQILLDKHNGDIPKTAREMIDDLPGVGPKMAFLIETIAWGTTSGIGVDTHMHRMFNQIKWVPDTKNPEQTRIELEAWLPREKWSSVNYLWVGFGQESQQQKPKMLRKALDCSRPGEALKLLKQVGMDPIKEGEKSDCLDEVKRVLGRK